LVLLVNVWRDLLIKLLLEGCDVVDQQCQQVLIALQIATVAMFAGQRARLVDATQMVPLLPLASI